MTPKTKKLKNGILTTAITWTGPPHHHLATITATFVSLVFCAPCPILTSYAPFVDALYKFKTHQQVGL